MMNFPSYSLDIPGRSQASRPIGSIIAAFFVILWWPADLCAQQLERITLSEPGRYTIDPAGRGSTEVIVQGQSSAHVLIELNGTPLGRIPQLHTRTAAIMQLRDALSSARREISDLHRRQLLGAGQLRFLRDYTTAFHGLSAEVPEHMIPLLAGQPFVRAVHRVVTVRASLDQSTRIIRAPELRALRSVDGSGVRVAVLDTGIDYLHPALGSGFGPGFLVAGGYDFVNNDNDPMDDNLHGTHVAGIIASRDSLYTGVAPGASLYAVKVLDRQGSGTTDQILAGIEWCLDPDGNGDFSDRMHIVNMSLGGDGDPDDPMSTAVDIVSRQGVLVVVAGGNAGGYSRIGSPGTSREALTVGAVDDLKAMAPFSSRGPSRKLFGVKPEVVAPGVSIMSTGLGQSFVALDGTSMAAPHVAGVAALLKQLYPAWNARELKSAIATQAVDAGFESVAQGAGVVDAVRSSEVRTFAHPVTASFGLVDAAVPTWNRSVQIVLRNTRPMAQTYQFSSGILPAGVGLTSSNASLTVPSSDSAVVTLSIEVQNASVPERAGGYGGLLRFSGSMGDTLHIPWSISKTSILTVRSDIPYIQFILSNAQTSLSSLSEALWSSDGLEATIYCPRGTYGLMADKSIVDGTRSKLYLWFADGVDVDIAREVQFTTAQLQRSVAFRSVNEEGVAFRDMDSSVVQLDRYTISAAFPPGSAFSRATFVETPVDTIRMTSMPPGFRLSVAGLHATHDRSRWYSINYPTMTAVSSDMVLSLDPSALLPVDIGLSLPASFTDIRMNSSRTDEHTHPTAGVTSSTWYAQSVDHPLGSARGTVRLYLNDPAGDLYRQSIGLSLKASDGQRQVVLDTPPVRIREGRITAYTLGAFTPHTQSVAPGGTLWFSPGPHFSEGGLVRIQPLLVHPFFRGSDYAPVALRDSAYVEASVDGAPLYQGHLRSFDVLGFLTAGAGRLTMHSVPVPVGGSMSRSSVTYTFRFDQPAQVPAVRTLESMDGTGRRRSHFARGDTARLQWTTTDSETPVVHVRKNGSTWQPLAVVPGGSAGTIRRDHSGSRTESLWKAELTHLTDEDSVLFDLRIVLKNGPVEAAYEIVPAIVVGETGVVTNAPGILAEASGQRSYSLSQNYPNPFNPETRLTFTVPLHSRVTVRVYDALGREVAEMLDAEVPAGERSVVWRADGMPSGIYVARLFARGIDGSVQTLTRKMLLLR